MMPIFIFLLQIHFSRRNLQWLAKRALSYTDIGAGFISDTLDGHTGGHLVGSGSRCRDAARAATGVRGQDHRHHSPRRGRTVSVHGAVSGLGVRTRLPRETHWPTTTQPTKKKNPGDSNLSGL